MISGRNKNLCLIYYTPFIIHKNDFFLLEVTKAPQKENWGFQTHMLLA